MCYIHDKLWEKLDVYIFNKKIYIKKIIAIKNLKINCLNIC